MTTPVFDRLVRRPEVEFRTGLKRSTMYSYIKQGSFPRPISLGTAHSVAWLSSEIDAWIEARIRAVRGRPATYESDTHAPEVTA